jgi:hypothetical protein
MRNRRGRWLVFCFLIGTLSIFGFSQPAASQPVAAIFEFDGEPPFKFVREVDDLESGEYLLSLEIDDTQGNLTRAGLQEEPSQPGLLWLYILMVAIIAVIGGTIVFLVKTRPTHSQPDTSGSGWTGKEHDQFSAEVLVDQTITETREGETVYDTTYAAVGNGSFERSESSILFDEAVVKQPSAVAAYLIVEHVEGEEQKYHLFENDVSIGRDKDVYIMLLDKKVSRHHSEISYQDGEYIFVDNQPSNPSHINGEIYNGPHVIRDNDEFIIGETRIVFKRA